MRVSLSAALFVSATLLVAGSVQAQRSVPPAIALREAHTLYYLPRDRGLEGFQCDVSFDWKHFIEQATHGPVDNSSDRLAYLRSIQLTVSDGLNSTGQLNWKAPAAAPQTGDDSVAQIRDSLQQMWSGFFQTWNPLYTGDAIGGEGPATVVNRLPTGYHAFTRQGPRTAEQSFSGDFTLRYMHVSTPDFDSVITPAFEPTPQGRLVIAISSTTSKPPTAPPTTVKMSLQYAPVNGFHIPSELLIDVVGTATFDFHLSNCALNVKPPAPPKP